MRNAKGKNIYTSQDKSDWNLYKVSVWMGRNLYKPVQIRGLYKKKELYGRVVQKTDDNCDRVIFLALFLPIYPTTLLCGQGMVIFLSCTFGEYVGIYPI